MNYNCFQIKVPATSANLGSGFDTLGIALNIYNKFTVQILKENRLIFEGIDKKYANPDNLFYRSFLEVFKSLNLEPPGIKVIENNEIPFGKGLGSSATQIIAGLIAGNIICNNILTKENILNLATKIEGHPDNVAPALYGNLTTSMVLEHETINMVNKVNPIFNFSILIPDFDMPTGEARKILPKHFDTKDIVYNISHALITYESLIEGNIDNLSKALGDKLHQPYRFKYIDDYPKFEKIFKEHHAIGSYLSGAGPSIVFITEKNNITSRKQIKENIQKNFKHWQYRDLQIDKNGTTKKFLTSTVAS